MNKKHIAVIFGGKSPEHEVSVITGLQTIENIDREKFEVIPIYFSKLGQFFTGPQFSKIETFKNLEQIPTKATQVNFVTGGVQSVQSSFLKKPQFFPIDIIFPTFHGGLGENGGFAGLFEVMNIPYVGPGITGGVLGMDKVVMKYLFGTAGIPITTWLWFTRSEFEEQRFDVIKRLEKKLAYPFFIKPANGGSSIGTTKAHDTKELENALEVAALFDKKIVVEESFENSREINISILGNAGSNLELSVCEEVFATSEVLTYEDKYIGNSKSGSAKGMAQTKRKIPADISKEIEEKIRTIAKQVFVILDGSGVSRIDFLYREKTQEIVVLEINTIPGSLSYYLWEASGLSFKDMITKLIELAEERYQEQKKNTTTFASNILHNFNSKGSKGKA